MVRARSISSAAAPSQADQIRAQMDARRAAEAPSTVLQRSTSFFGLFALVGLCWNLLQWGGEELPLPPTEAPQAERSRWRPASAFNLRHWMDRASHSGLRLYRPTPHDPLEIEDTANTAESAAWQAWLQQPLQRRLRLAG